MDQNVMAITVVEGSLCFKMSPDYVNVVHN